MNWKKLLASLMISIGLMLCSRPAFADLAIEAGDSIAEAGKVSLGNTYEGSISNTNTRDFYVFTVSNPAVVTLSATAHVEYINYRIYDSQGNEILSWRPTWNTSTRISMLNAEQQLAAGTYYFAVEQYSTPAATYSGDYSFKISAQSQVQFTDVLPNAYYADAVNWAVENDITLGVTSTTFGPNKDCTRGQIVSMLWRAAGSPQPKTTKNPFTDVKSSHYFYKAVLWAVENQITSGTTTTTFSPSTVCSRAQAMTFLWTTQGKPATLNTVQFKDVSPDAYYYQAVRWAVKNKITSGTTSATFSPNDRCTRAQIVAFIYQTMA